MLYHADFYITDKFLISARQDLYNVNNMKIKWIKMLLASLQNTSIKDFSMLFYVINFSKLSRLKWKEKFLYNELSVMLFLN